MMILAATDLVATWGASIRKYFAKATIEAPIQPTWSDTVIVLELPSYSDSIHFRVYDERVGDRSVLEWAIGRLRRWATADAAVYVQGSRSEARRLEQVLAERLGASYWPCSGTGGAQDLHSLARKSGKSWLLTMDLTATLLPSAVFDDLRHYHSVNRLQATSLVGLPCAVSPVLINAEFLSMLANGPPGIPRQLLPHDLRATLSALERAIQATNKRVTPVRIGRRAPVSIEEQVRRRWPYVLHLHDVNDIEILRRGIDRCESRVTEVVGENEPLDTWSQLAGEFQQQRIGALRTPSSHDLNGGRRVLFAQGPSAFSGGEQVLVDLAKSIGNESVPPFETIALIAFAGTLTDRLAQAGAEVHIAHRPFTANSVENFLYSRRLLGTVKPALVHSHTFAGLPFSCAVAESGIPFVQHIHVADERLLTPLSDQATLASAIIAVSDFVKHNLIRLGVDPRKVHVIRNGVRLGPEREPGLVDHDITRAAARARTRQLCGVPEHAPVVLVVARFVPYKRHDVAVDSFARLHARLPDAYLLLVGEAFAADTPVLEAVQKQVARLQLREHVRFLGFRQEMPDFYAAADVLMLPSEREPLGLAVLEAMAAGLPVVGARSGGIPEMIEHTRSGLLVEPGNSEGFSAALHQTLSDADLRRVLVDGGRARCRAEFSVSRFAGEVSRLYERLLSHGPMAVEDI